MTTSPSTTRTATGFPVSQPVTRSSGLLVCLVAMVALGSTFAMSVATGSFGIPHNDDWSYLRSAEVLHSTGHIRLVGWAQMSLVGQLVLSQPALLLHNSIGALQVWCLLLAFLAVIATFALGYELRLGALSVVTACLLVCNPVFPSLSVTFMTDVPALSLTLLSLWLGAVALRGLGRRRTGMLAAALATGVVATTIREFAIVAPLAVVLAMAWPTIKTRQWSETRAILVHAALWGLVLIGFLLWRRTLPAGLPYPPLRLGNLGLPTLRLLTTLSLFLGPVLLLPVREAATRTARCVALAIGGLISLAVALKYGVAGSLCGNYLQRGGPIGPLARGVRESALPAAVWTAAGAAALFFTPLLFLRLADFIEARRRFRRTAEPPAYRLILVAAVASLAVLVYGQAHGKIYDRYLLLPTVLLGLGLLLNVRELSFAVPGRLWTRIPAALAGICLLAIGVCVAGDIDSYDGVRWRAGMVFVKSGISPSDIDAGAEWVGYFAKGIARPVSEPGSLPVWDRRMGVHPCFIVAESQLDDPSLVLLRRMHWRDFFLGTKTVENYENRSADCESRRPLPANLEH